MSRVGCSAVTCPRALRLHAVDVHHPVPDQTYAAVAEVLAYVYQLKGKKLQTPPRAA